MIAATVVITSGTTKGWWPWVVWWHTSAMQLHIVVSLADTIP
jgi:hypothetical protein